MAIMRSLLFCLTSLSAASALVTVPPPPEAAVSVNVDIRKAFNEIKSHPSAVKNGITSYIQSVQTLNEDLAEVLPLDAVSLEKPQNLKTFVRSAASGQAQVNVNGEPVLVNVESTKGTLDITVSSNLLPKIPFMAPVVDSTRVQEETGVVSISEEIAAPTTDNNKKSVLRIGDYDLTFVQIGEGLAAAVVAAYATSFGFYTYQNEQSAASKKKKKAAPKVEEKTAAPKDAPKVEAKTEPKEEQSEPLVTEATATDIPTRLEKVKKEEIPEEQDDEETGRGRRLKRWMGLKREEVTK